MADKTCSTCGNDYPATPEFFFRQRNKPDGLTCRCKSCHNKSVKKWVKNNRHKRVIYMRNARLRLKYKINPEDYAKLHAAQDGKCALCERPETKTIKGVTFKLCVDHDHITGRVRSLLCNACNRAIGLLLDDPVILRKAADYIEKSRNCSIFSVDEPIKSATVQP